MKNSSPTGNLFACWTAPIGELGLVLQGESVCEVVCRSRREAVLAEIAHRHPAARKIAWARTAAGRQIGEYFAGRRRCFELSLLLPGMSAFPAAVLHELRRIPFGETVTYAGLAALAGHPRAARAVGRIMATNLLPILIPCHRVVGAGGRLTGYSAGHGLASKEWLLAFERSFRQFQDARQEIVHRL